MHKVFKRTSAFGTDDSLYIVVNGIDDIIELFTGIIESFPLRERAKEIYNIYDNIDRDIYFLVRLTTLPITKSSQKKYTFSFAFVDRLKLQGVTNSGVLTRSTYEKVEELTLLQYRNKYIEQLLK